MYEYLINEETVIFNSKKERIDGLKKLFLIALQKDPKA